MPTYDYQCDACGHRFEEFQSMRDDALTVCPSCNEAALRRLITGGTGVIFKGSGFYVTDSKKKSPSSSGGTAASSKPNGSDAKSGDGKSTDAKSDTGSGGGTKTDGSSGGENGSKTTSSGEKKTA